jgi:hypothetical protein
VAGASPTTQQAVELFHLHFCRALFSGEYRSHYVVKGGCNLRFFFGSIRYSEDLDLDVAVGAPGTLKRRVDKLLESPALQLPLRAAGIELSGISAPKQTETTQRWKLALAVQSLSVPLRTKVEFSRRTKPKDTAVDAVRAEVALRHRITAPVLCHYRVGEAIEQKVMALAGRPELQARDVFDLDWLFTQAPAGASWRGLDPEVVELAAQRARRMDEGRFAAQVMPYLEEDRRGEFAGTPAWEALRDRVAGRLESLVR